MTGAIYSRFSTDRQSETSLADQERVCREFAKARGWEVLEHYSDAGISGAAMGNRPAFLRMRSDAMAGRFGVLLVMDTSRLSRSQELAPLIERLRYQGVRVIGVQDGFDSAAGHADMQAGLSGIMSVEFRRMIRARTHAALEGRAKERRPTGGKAYGYHGESIDRGEAFIVREIFGRFADGQSTHSIAADLNARRIPSPGASWRRTTRRANGWAGSGIRAILRNERYAGRLKWNASEWRKDPDTGRRRRVARPPEEWVTHQVEDLRIVSEELFERVVARFARIAEGGHWAQPKGKVKYLLSGLLRCATCGAHYVIANRHEYGCSAHADGAACSNGIRVRRSVLEEAILGPVRRELLSPERIATMAKKMQAYYLERVRGVQARSLEAPAELAGLAARIERLHERLRRGDPDMTPDEIEAAIERAEGKLAEFEAARPQAQAKVLAMLPKAAELYRRQLERGLEGDERAALKARILLRELLGRIDLKPEGDGELWAEYGVAPAALVKVVGFDGSGGLLCSYPPARIRHRVK